MKINYIIPELFIPIVEYKIFHPKIKVPIILNICEEININLTYHINKELKKETFIYDL